MNVSHYRYIDALRGYAILLVMAVHASEVATGWQGVGRKLIDQGARGVQLFFVASALTLMMSWHSRNDGVVSFYIRRFFRIAPMFWLGILFFLWLEGFGPRYFAPNGIEVNHIYLTFLFLNGWHPEYITSVVHGGWSIAVEMTFYMVFPILVFFIRGWKSAVFILFLTNFISNICFQSLWINRFVIWPGVSDDLVSTFLNLYFPTQLPVFIVGFLVFFIIRDRKICFPVFVTQILFFLSLILMVVMAIDYGPVKIFSDLLAKFVPFEFRYGYLYFILSDVFYISPYVMYGLCFGVFAFYLSTGAGIWFVNAPVRYLGKVSFSAYLSHFAILGSVQYLKNIGLYPFSDNLTTDGFFFIQFFVYLVTLTVLVSTVTYRVIELPMVKIGNKLLSRLWLKIISGK